MLFRSAKEKVYFSSCKSRNYFGKKIDILGFNSPKLPNATQAFAEINLEQLVMEKPDYMFIAHYRQESIARKWEAEPLWQAIPAVKAKRVFSVNADMWARGRGITASEIMAKQVEQFVNQK